MQVHVRGWQAAIGALSLLGCASVMSACNGDDDDSAPTPTRSTTSSGTRTASGSSMTSSGTRSSSGTRTGAGGSRSSSGTRTVTAGSSSDPSDNENTDVPSSGTAGKHAGWATGGRGGSSAGTRVPKGDDSGGSAGSDSASPVPDESSGPSSGSHGSTTVTIDFKAKIDGVEFACGETYPNIGSAKTTVTPLDLRLFVQDVKLIRADGSSVPVELDVRKPWQSQDVALLDFEDGTGNCGEGTPERNSKITGHVPADTYVGVSFVNGVPDALNHVDPSQQQDPLKTFSNLSWGWLGGFRFTKIELMEAVKPNQDFGSGILHTGSTACSGNAQAGKVTCSKPNRNQITLDHFDPDTNYVVIDIAPVFAKTDLSGTAECHAAEDTCKTMFSALGIDFSTGLPAKSQAVYSVE